MKKNEFLRARGQISRAIHQVSLGGTALEEAIDALMKAGVPPTGYSGLQEIVKQLKRYHRILVQIREENFTL